MDYFPLFFKARERRCVVVGGGEVALRKVSLLLEAGACVQVVSPKLHGGLASLHREGRIAWEEKRFEPGDLGEADLVIAATDDSAVNRAVSAAAQGMHLPVNVVDSPDLCTFVVPSIIDRSPLVIGVSTGGASPVLARIVRARLETLIPAAYGQLARMAAAFRDKVKGHFKRGGDRRIFWERVLEGPIAEMIFAGREKEAYDALERAIDSAAEGASEIGEVYLIGGGPGDPDLLTFRALRLLQRADVVVHDRLVTQQVIDLARRDAQRIYVGKERSNHAVPQEDINHLLVRLAKEGKRVARLKGGDPFIFGRGGEEIETLAAEGVPFQIVPGITAASGCASYAGIPLTHRDYAQSCLFVTGHLKDGTMDLNWKALVQPAQTLCIYMGLTGLEVLCRELVAHGMSSDMPAALVQQGTTPNQRVLVGTLSTLPQIVESTGVRAPTMIIIGEVVQLRDKLAWFEPELMAAEGRNPHVTPERVASAQR
jgi:uroporphyrin-III C-methyltransferase/precorrin-2 dehydrogenase/sirohydrochlorin ferrochelatase